MSLGGTIGRLARLEYFDSGKVLELGPAHVAEQIKKIVVPSPLERLGSLIMEEESRDSKRLRNLDGICSTQELSANNLLMGQNASPNDENMSLSSDEMLENDNQGQNHEQMVHPDSERVAVSYAKVVAGSSANINYTSALKCVEEVVITDDDVRILREGPFPTVQFSDRTQALLDHSLRKTLIVKLLGRQIGY
ncbi:hypothetical protein V6N13_021727 [Hibiscus sabdariffa]